jgi:hypothetical protein
MDAGLSRVALLVTFELQRTEKACGPNRGPAMVAEHVFGYAEKNHDGKGGLLSGLLPGNPKTSAHRSSAVAALSVRRRK